jgi:hypothetical protein
MNRISWAVAAEQCVARIARGLGACSPGSVSVGHWISPLVDAQHISRDPTAGGALHRPARWEATNRTPPVVIGPGP